MSAWPEEPTRPYRSVRLYLWDVDNGAKHGRYAHEFMISRHADHPQFEIEVHTPAWESEDGQPASLLVRIDDERTWPAQALVRGSFSPWIEGAADLDSEEIATHVADVLEAATAFLGPPTAEIRLADRHARRLAALAGRLPRSLVPEHGGFSVRDPGETAGEPASGARSSTAHRSWPLQSAIRDTRFREELRLPASVELGVPPSSTDEPEQVDIDSYRFDPTTILTRDGAGLAAEVCASKTDEILGALIFVHGFCGDKGENGLFRALAAHCSAKGFHAVLYDWRGLAHSDGDFPASTLWDHVEDFEQVVDWTRARFPETFGVSALGFSLGAAIVGLAVRRQASLESVAYLSPAVRPRLSMWPRYNTKHIRRELAKRGVVEKPGSSVLLGQAILRSLRDTDLGPSAFDINMPLLVCHGTDDARIGCSHSRNLVASRVTASDLEYIEFPGASHSFRPADANWQRLGFVVSRWLARTAPSADARF